MKYGHIAGSNSVNDMIYRCLEYISDEDVKRFLREFKAKAEDELQLRHIFRELILGAYLVSTGLLAEYERRVDTKTPDWSVLNQNSSLSCIVELVNFHLNKELEDEINSQLEAGRFWIGFQPPNDNRLYDRIDSKASSYKIIVEQFQIPYVIAVFGEFTASVNRDELDVCLFDAESGLFRLYPQVSGVLYFEELAGQYHFQYLGNPRPSLGFEIPSGIL
jgi:hypothetical protein